MLLMSKPKPVPSLSLRTARLDDNAFIRSLFVAALPLYEALLPRSFPGNLTTLDILTAKGLDFSATGLDGWIAENPEGLPVGFAGVGPLNPDQAYMAALYLKPGHKRRGYGSEILARLEAHYEQAGFKELLLLVHARAPWALKFYQSQGYDTIATSKDAMIAYGGQRLEHLIEAELLLLGKPLKQLSDPDQPDQPDAPETAANDEPIK